MKITYIVNVFPKLSETFILDQIVYLLDRGHDVNVIAAADWEEEQSHEELAAYRLREKTLYLPKSRDEPGFKLVSSLFRHLAQTEIIHAHFANWPAQTALKIHELTGIPFVVTAHANDIFVNPEPASLASLAENCCRFVTVTHYNKEFLLGMLGQELCNKIDVLRCGIRTDLLQPAKREFGHQTVILSCGRFVEKKGIKYAIRAFARLQDKSAVQFRIIGDGPLEAEIRGEIEALGISGHVVLLGPQPRAAVVKELRNADLFVLPSVTADDGDREGLPVSILEAQSVGLPVVSTLHSGIPEGVLDGKTAFLVQERDVDALADRIERLVTDPNLRHEMGRRARQFIISQFDAGPEFSRLEKILSDCVVGSQRFVDPELTRERTIARCESLASSMEHQSARALNEARKSIGTLETSVDRLKSALEGRNRRIDRLEQSLSWRLTSPLRKAAALVRKMGRR